ncbi:MAG: hypothetical protein AAFX06_11655 [Planctomycetota bacterium]
MKRYLWCLVALASVTVGGCSSSEPEVLEYTADEVAQMDADMGIGADGEQVGDTEFEKID